MELKFVESKNIIAMGYDDDTQTMAVQFKGGKVYHYHHVPRDLYETVRDAPSIGREFAYSIRDQFDGVLQ